MNASANQEIIIKDVKNDGPGESGATGFLAGVETWMLSRQRFKLKQKVIFFRLLATMANAGLPILKSLAILERQEKNPVAKTYFGRMISGIKSGKNLSATLRDFDGNFTDAECSIIESGEKTGKLNNALVQLADQVEKVADIIIVMFICIGVLMTLVVPKLVTIFGEREKLPPMTQFLLSVSDVFVNYWWAMLLCFGIVVAFLKIWKNTPEGHYRFDMGLLYLPIVGPIVRKVVLSKFSRVLSNLLSSGISIVESLRIVSEVVDHEVYRQRIMLLREDIKKGVKIGEGLEDDALFPDMLVQMIKVGEETARLDSIILKIADFYDAEVDATVNAINKTIEPVIIVIMAVVVGFIALGILQPIMNLSEIMAS
jgi:type II secretory pathway component PulF